MEDATCTLQEFWCSHVLRFCCTHGTELIITRKPFSKLCCAMKSLKQTTWCWTLEVWATLTTKPYWTGLPSGFMCIDTLWIMVFAETPHKEEVDTKPHPVQENMCNRCLRISRKSVSPMDCLSTTLQGSPNTISIPFCVCDHFFKIFLLVSPSPFLFFLLFSWERKREHEVALHREVGGPGKIREGEIRLHRMVAGIKCEVLYNPFWTMLFLTRTVSLGHATKGLFRKDRIKLWNVGGVWQVEIEKRK